LGPALLGPALWDAATGVQDSTVKLFLFSLAVLVVDDVHVRGLLLRLVLAEVGGSPAHNAAVPNAPDPGADVASIEPRI
jgi:hypothetical protein